MEIVAELSATHGRAEVIASLEQAASLAASQTAGRALTVRLDPDTGDLACFASKRVVEEVNDPEAEVLFSAAPEGAEVGQTTEVPAPLGAAVRSAARAGREVLDARLRGGKLLAQADRYRSRIGKLETATVTRREGADLIVDLGPVEGRIPSREQSRHEVFNPEDTVRASVVAVEAEEPPVILSRIRPELLAGVIERETPEVRRGTVEVRATARRPGLRAKAAVWSGVHGVNPVAACLGPGGARIRAVSRELRGEQVDVVLWSGSPERFARNALRPAEILGIRPAKPGEIAVRPSAARPGDRRRRPDGRRDGQPDRDRGRDRGGDRGPRREGSRGPARAGARVESGAAEFPHGLVVTVTAEELPRALGKRGQNVRLASELVGFPIEVVEEGGSPRPLPESRRPQRGGPDRGGPDRRGSDRPDRDRGGPDRRGSDRRDWDRRDWDRRGPDRGGSDREWPRRGAPYRGDSRRGDRERGYRERGDSERGGPRRGGPGRGRDFRRESGEGPPRRGPRPPGGSNRPGRPPRRFPDERPRDAARPPRPPAERPEPAPASHAAVGGASVPDASVPDASVPGPSVRDASVPDVSVPGASAPGASVPDVSAPESEGGR